MGLECNIGNVGKEVEIELLRNSENGLLMAGNEVEDGNDARNPADEDDGNSSNKCVPRVVFVQRLLNDHVDALIKDKYLESAHASSTCRRSVMASPNPVMRMSMKMTLRMTRTPREDAAPPASTW